MLRWTSIGCGLLLLAGAFADAQQAERPEPGVVRFSGREWEVKDSGGSRVGPGPNWFSAANVSVDSAGKLHLKASEREGGCVSSEVIASQSLGYGTYHFKV